MFWRKLARGKLARGKLARGKGKGASSFQPSAVRLRNKLARGKGKVASFEGRDASCRRRFNAEKRVIRYQSLEVRLKILKLASFKGKE